MPGPEVYAGCPFMGRLAGRGLDPSAAARGLAALRISRNRLRRGGVGDAALYRLPQKYLCKTKSDHLFLRWPL